MSDFRYFGVRGLYSFAVPPPKVVDAIEPQAGDFAVIRTRGPAAVVIRLVTRSEYNHAVFFISSTHVVEAKPHGAVISPWSKYAKCKFKISYGLPLNEQQRAAAPVAGILFVGTPYGWLDIFSVGLLQYGIKPKLVRDRVAHQINKICSQLVDQARLTLNDHLFCDGRLPQDVTPGDLGKLI